MDSSSPPGYGIQGLDHVGILVRQANEAARDFATGYGFRIVHEETLTSPPVRLIYLECGGETAIQLLEPTGDGPLREAIAANGEGLHHLCLTVSDLGAKALRSDHPALASWVGGYGRRCTFLLARPHGVLLELAEAAPR